MSFKFSSVINWFKKILSEESRAKLWHFFPVGNDLNIKSMLEILVYLAIIVGGFYLYISFNKIETQSYKIQVENLLSKDINDMDMSLFLKDTITSHIANVKFYMPYKYDNNNRTRPIFIPNDFPFFKKDTAEMCHGHISFGFWSDHTILRTKEQLIMDYRFNDDIYIPNNYHGLKRYINRHYPKESFKDTVWLDSLISINIKDIMKSMDFDTYNTDTIKNLSKAVEAFNNTLSNLQQGYGKLALWTDIVNAYKDGHNIDPFFRDDDYIYKIFKDNNKSYNQNQNLILLRDYFINKLKDSIGEDRYSKLSDENKYPINYYSVTSPKFRKHDSVEGWIKGGIAFANLQKVQSSSANGIYSQWIQGKHEAPGFLNTAEITTRFSNSLFWLTNDISQSNYHFDLVSGSIDSINLVIDFGNICEFSNMDPMPDVITKSSIKFTDQWKILKIKNDGLDFHVKFVELENLQEIRLFIIQAVISGLIVILITFLIISLYKVFRRKKKQIPVNNKKLSLLETDGISTDIIDNL